MAGFAFFLACVWLVLLLLRPTDLFYAWRELPVLFWVFLAAGPVTLVSYRRFFHGAQFPLMFGLIMAIGLSVVANGWLTGGGLAIRDFIPSAAAFYLVAENCNSKERIRKVFWIFVVSAAVMALHGISQLDDGFGWTGIPSIKGRITYAGIFNDPNDMGLMFICVMPMLAYLKSRAGGFLSRSMYYALGALFIYAIFLTGSRGTMLGLLALATLFVLHRKGRMKAAVLVTILIPIVFVLLPERFQEINPSEASAFSRLDAWYVGMQMLVNDPLFGVGYGSFLDHHERTAHNSLVLALAELGMLGYMFWIMLLASVTRSLFREYQTAKATDADNDQTKLALTLLYSIFAFAVGGFFLSRSYSALLFTLFGLACAQAMNMFSARNGGDSEGVLIKIEKSTVIACIVSVPIMAIVIKVLYAFV